MILHGIISIDSKNLGTGMAQISLLIFAIWSLFFFAYYLRWMYISETHLITEIRKKNAQQPHVVRDYNAKVSLHKVISFSFKQLYCLKYKNTISRTRLNLSLFHKSSAKGFVAVGKAHVSMTFNCNSYS